jgi:2-dehydropantoate 2-reductase
MKISILGAGAMGSLFGGLLAEAGEAVTLLDVNQSHLDAIRSSGLRLQTDRGDRYITDLQACRPEEASDAPDLLIVFTKTLHTRAALQGAKRLLAPDTCVLTLQNGLGNVEAIGESVPLEQVLVGVTTWPADVVGAGQVHSHGEGAIRLATADGAVRAMLGKVTETLNRAGLNAQADTSVWQAIWEKVAFNAALNSLCAVTGCTVDQLDGAVGGKVLAMNIVDEVIAVAHASGVQADGTKTRDNVSHAIAAHVGHKPSMLQDVLAGRPSEIEFINGAVVEAARRLGVPAVHTECLLTLVRLIEAARKGSMLAAPSH